MRLYNESPVHDDTSSHTKGFSQGWIPGIWGGGLNWARIGIISAECDSACLSLSYSGIHQCRATCLMLCAFVRAGDCDFVYVFVFALSVESAD